MVKLKLKFTGEDGRQFDIKDGERLNDVVAKALDGVPLGKFSAAESFQVIVNGMKIEGDFWPTIALKETDAVVISPNIKSGDSGQIFKSIAIIAITIVASIYLTPAGGATIGSALAVGAVTMAATLLLNALIPPPVASVDDLGVGSTLSGSQMYSISGQSNQVRLYQTVPRVYGQFRMFPSIAANPYTELAVDPLTGETIQYLYAIYDFGLGTSVVNGLQIGDTPLNTESFSDFQFNFVDLAYDGAPQDIYDQGLKTSFSYYKNRREITSLALALDNLNDESIQNTDATANSVAPEIVLDFVATKGLYGYSSGGTLGPRSILLEVEFAPVGTSDWRAYNDLSYVSSHEVVGGTDVNSNYASFAPTLTDPNTTRDAWYGLGMTYIAGPYNFNEIDDFYVMYGVNVLLLTAGTFEPGAKVFYGNRLLGIIQSVDTVTFAPNVQLTLDRVITPYLRDVKAYEWSDLDGFTFIGSVRIDRTGSGSAIITGMSTSPVYGSIRFTPKTPGQYQVRVRRAATTGPYNTEIGDSLTWGAITTAYQGAPIITNKRHIFMELKIRATDQLNGNISTLSGIVTSVLPVYEPDTGIWTRQPTANPAWVFADLLTGEVNKKAIPSSSLDLNSLVEWAEFCDQVPDSPAGTTFTWPRFQCNMVLDYATTLQDLLSSIGGAAQASLNLIDGKYGVLIDKLRTTPVQIFTPRNSKNFSSTRSYSVRPSGVKVTFIDPNSAWATAEIDVFDNGFTTDDSADLEALTSFACTNSEQAWRFGRYMLGQNTLRQELINLLVDFEFLACTRGDFVQITQDVMEVGGTPARVKSVTSNSIVIDDSLDIDDTISYGYTYRGQDGTIATSTLTPTSPNGFDLDGAIPEVGDLIVIGAVGQIVLDCIVKSITPNDDTSATLVLVEKADGIYDYESTDTFSVYTANISATSSPDLRPPLPITSLVISGTGYTCDPSGNGINYYITLTWDMPVGAVFELFEIWVNDGTGYRSIATTKIKTYTYTVDHTRLGIEHDFKVVAVSSTGKKLQLIAMPEVSTTPGVKTVPPPDISSLDMSITNQVLQLSWPASPDCSVFQYVLRYSPESNDLWEASIPLATLAKNVTSTSVQARTGIYFIKAVDVEGNESVNAAEAITTIPDLIDLNVIDTLNDAPAFVGEFDSTELLGEAVILSEQVHGDVNSVQYYTDGYYTFADIFDLGDIFSVRLQSLIRADGYRKDELMSEWVELDLVDHLNTALHSDWDISLQYRASDTFEAMSDWTELAFIDHINEGAGLGFTDWRDIPSTGDATGRVFQFRAHLQSLTANVTPRLFDATVQVDMPDRTDSFNGLTSDASAATEIDYDPVFAGPSPSPNVQVSIDNAQSGDYWSFDSKTLAGLQIRFYDKTGTQVVRQFDVQSKGYGRQHTQTL